MRPRPPGHSNPLMPSRHIILVLIIVARQIKEGCLLSTACVNCAELRCIHEDPGPFATHSAWSVQLFHSSDIHAMLASWTRGRKRIWQPSRLAQAYLEACPTDIHRMMVQTASAVLLSV